MTVESVEPKYASTACRDSQAPSPQECIETLIDVLPRLTRVLKSQMRGSKLSGQHMFMLMTIQDLTQINEDGAQPGELARRACISSAAITAALDDLVDEGFCVRAHSEKDRRKVLVHLTPLGMQALAEVRANTRKAFHGVLDGWDDDRRLVLCQVLRDLDATALTLLNQPLPATDRSGPS